MSASNDWKEWKNLVLVKINSTEASVNELRTKDIPDIKIEIASLKTKARLWGGIAGMLFGGILTIVVRILV